MLKEFVLDKASVKTSLENASVDNPVTDHLQNSSTMGKVCIQLLEGRGHYIPEEKN